MNSSCVHLAFPLVRPRLQIELQQARRQLGRALAAWQAGLEQRRARRLAGASVAGGPDHQQPSSTPEPQHRGDDTQVGGRGHFVSTPKG